MSVVRSDPQVVKSTECSNLTEARWVNIYAIMKKSALPVITTVASWQLMHLGT